MADSSDLEARVSALENRVSELDAETRTAREDAAAARHLAAARDRDLADLTIKVDATRSAVNALGVQTRGQFDGVDRRLDEMNRKLDAAAGGQAQIVGLLDTLIAREDGQ